MDRVSCHFFISHFRPKPGRSGAPGRIGHRNQPVGIVVDVGRGLVVRKFLRYCEGPDMIDGKSGTQLKGHLSDPLNFRKKVS